MGKDGGMNARERLFAALDGEGADHVPIWLLFPYHRVPYYADVRLLPQWRELHEMSLRHGVTLNRRGLHASLFAPEVKRSSRTEERGGVSLKTELIEWGRVRLLSESSVSAGRTSVKKFLETEEDLEALCSLPLNTDRETVWRQLDAQLERYMKERSEFPPELGAMMLDLGEPVGCLYSMSNLEEFAIWSLTRAPLIESFLDRVMLHHRLAYEYCLERNLAEVYFMVGSELAAPPLVGVETFKRWIVPYAKELIGMAHSHGAKVVQHFHGQIRGLLPYFVEMGADALHTIEAPLVGNCTMTEAYEVVGDSMSLIGNIQYDDFCRWEPERMKSETRKLLDECRGRRFILSPTAGPYDPNPPPAAFANYKAFMEAAWSHPWS